MNFSFKPLHEQVIVITGASSGIGLATARAASKEGAKLVLISRNDDVLAQTVQEINSDGGEAIHVTADVGQRQELQAAADAAISRFGRIDTWVNNAGVSIFGRIEEVSDEDNQRLFQTNFWGTVYGSLIALPHLKRQGGALINLGSVVSDQPVPLQGMYSASKHAVKGFTDALRMELMEEKAPVSVTLIKPAAIDTPYPQHARNYLSQEPKLPPPVYSAEEVAHGILFAATHAKRDIYIGGGGRGMSVMGRLAPHMMDQVGSRMLSKQQTRNEPPRDPAGALHQAGHDGRVSGDHPGHVMRTSLYTRSSLHPALSAALVAGAGALTFALMKRNANGRYSRPPRRIAI
jgi:short-subunit dehydrogenase